MFQKNEGKFYQQAKNKITHTGEITKHGQVYQILEIWKDEKRINETTWIKEIVNRIGKKSKMCKSLVLVIRTLEKEQK